MSLAPIPLAHITFWPKLFKIVLDVSKRVGDILNRDGYKFYAALFMILSLSVSILPLSLSPLHILGKINSTRFEHPYHRRKSAGTFPYPSPYTSSFPTPPSHPCPQPPSLSTAPKNPPFLFSYYRAIAIRTPTRVFS